ncbi:hypothetical protein DB459_27175 [Bradyrhizobium sp. WD16]|nr:hypothetical protein DB459_27175 [Bradyrhizobium sp. WD16]
MVAVVTLMGVIANIGMRRAPGLNIGLELRIRQSLPEAVREEIERPQRRGGEPRGFDGIMAGSTVA